MNEQICVQMFSGPFRLVERTVGMEKVKDGLQTLLKPAETHKPAITASVRGLKRVEAIHNARQARQQASQDVGFGSRPFVLCGLPVKRPPKGQLKHERRNGAYWLQVTGHEDYGLPFGQDRLIPIWIATMATRLKSPIIRFSAGADILDAFGLPKDGKTYRRLTEGFWRVFYSNVWFGIDSENGQMRRRAVENVRYIRRMALWETKHPSQNQLPGEDFENQIELSMEFWEEIQKHPIPCDLKVVAALSDSPAALDFYMWVAYRCWTARRVLSIPLFGTTGLQAQLGSAAYKNNRQFRLSVRRWIARTRLFWPECPAQISEDGESLVLSHAEAIAGVQSFLKPIR